MDSLLYRAYRRVAPPDFLYVALDKAACAAFVKESRMNFASANQFHRKSGITTPALKPAAATQRYTYLIGCSLPRSLWIIYVWRSPALAPAQIGIAVS